MSAQMSHSRIVLIGLASLAIAMGIGRFAFTPLLPLMQQDGLLGIADGGLLASVHFLGYWLGAVLAARLPSSPKATLRLSLIAIGLCTLGMGLTGHLAVWLALRWLAGACSAFIMVMVSNFYLKPLVADRRATKQGWVFSGVGAGIAIAGLGTLALMVLHIDSARSWQIFGIVSLAAAGLVCLRLGPEIPGSRAAAHRHAVERAPLHWRVVIAYGAAGIGYVIPATYLPVMARAIVPSPLVFGWTWPVFGAAAFVSTLLAARLQRRFTNRHLWATSQFIMAAGLLLPVVAPHIATIIVAGVCVGGTFMIVTMAGMQEAHRIAPPHDVMRHIAVMTAAFATGQMAGPLFAGAIQGVTGSFTAALLMTSALLLMTATSLILRPAKREIACP
jgi:predicted MFS family arabinose efflux permease